MKYQKELRKNSNEDIKAYFNLHNKNETVEDKKTVMIDKKSDEKIRNAVSKYIEETVFKPSEKKEPNI